MCVCVCVGMHLSLCVCVCVWHKSLTCCTNINCATTCKLLFDCIKCPIHMPLPGWVSSAATPPTPTTPLPTPVAMPISAHTSAHSMLRVMCLYGLALLFVLLSSSGNTFCSSRTLRSLSHRGRVHKKRVCPNGQHFVSWLMACDNCLYCLYWLPRRTRGI